MTPFDYARSDMSRAGVSPHTMQVFDLLVSAYSERTSPEVATTLRLFDADVARISGMTPEQALARVSTTDEPEAVAVLKTALAELADVKALDRFLDGWGERSRYAIRKNHVTAGVPAYSVVFYHGRFPALALPPVVHGVSQTYARRSAVRELKK